MPGPNGPQFEKPVLFKRVQTAPKAGLAGLLAALSIAYMHRDAISTSIVNADCTISLSLTIVLELLYDCISCIRCWYGRFSVIAGIYASGIDSKKQSPHIRGQCSVIDVGQAVRAAFSNPYYPVDHMWWRGITAAAHTIPEEPSFTRAALRAWLITHRMDLGTWDEIDWMHPDNVARASVI
jgi:hypothetical protein